MGWFSDLLSGVVTDTKSYLVKKHTMTVSERLAEMEAEVEVEEEVEEEEGSDDEAKAIYNPKNLPLGWDGKPIPYWLYKVNRCSVGSPSRVSMEPCSAAPPPHPRPSHPRVPFCPRVSPRPTSTPPC